MQFKAIYSDNTYFGWDEETCKPGSKPYYKIDQDRLAAFQLSDESGLRHLVMLDGDKRLVVTRRVWHNTKYGILQAIYLVGWQRTTPDGKNEQEIAVLFEDGTKEIITQWKDDGVRYPVNMELRRAA